MTIPSSRPNGIPDASKSDEGNATPGGIPPLHPVWLLIAAVAAGVAILTYYDLKAGAAVLVFLTVAGALYALLRK